MFCVLSCAVLCFAFAVVWSLRLSDDFVSRFLGLRLDSDKDDPRTDIDSAPCGQ